MHLMISTKLGRDKHQLLKMAHQGVDGNIRVYECVRRFERIVPVPLIDEQLGIAYVSR